MHGANPVSYTLYIDFKQLNYYKYMQKVHNMLVTLQITL